MVLPVHGQQQEGAVASSQGGRLVVLWCVGCGGSVVIENCPHILADQL
jgi:hypothetical protein